MAIQTINTGAWETVVTTAADTAFQNKSNSPIYLTTEDTTSLALDNGLFLEPNGVAVIASGNTVSATAFGADAELFYMAV